MKKIFLYIPLAAITGSVIFIACKKSPPPQSSTTTNKFPTARAGGDITVVLPANKVLLDGSSSSDTDGNIREYYWSNISGPASVNISSPTDQSTEVGSLVEGVYDFKLTVVDNGGYASSDGVKISVVYPDLGHEVKFENLIWQTYLDSNNLDADLYINSPLIPGSNLAYLFRVFVRTAFSPNWVEAKTIINGEFSSPFTYFIQRGVDSAYIQVSSFPWDGNLPGTIASLKLNY